MELSNAPDDALETLAKAALLRNPLGPMLTAMAMSVNADAKLPPAEADRWNRAIDRALTSLSEAGESASPQ